MEAIKFEKLSFKYPNANTLALDQVSISIQESEFVLVCGKSGCGKSTLLRHLKPSLTPYGMEEGEVLYYGKNIEKLDTRVSASQIGFVRQDSDNQIVTDKVWHELAFALENLGLESNEIKRKVGEMASFFGIQSWFKKNTNELSGGQKQLLNLVSVMVMQPKVLVLDEPTSQLDPISANEFINTLHKINQEFGTTIIISEHRLENLFPIVDKVLLMDDSKVKIFDSSKNVVDYIARTKNPMIEGLPSVMRIYADCENDNNFPLTVREGRTWLESKLGKGNYSKEKIKKIEKKENENFAIEIKNAYFKYERNMPYILNQLNLQVREGEILSVLGGNGTGKSTMLKAICNLIKLQDGKIKISGKDIKKLGNDLFENNISMVPQNPQSVFTEISCDDELMEALYYNTKSKEEKKYEVNKMIEMMELEKVRKSNPFDLSGGEQQRLCLGKILMLKPRILLLDEPTKGIDVIFKIKLGEMLNKLKNEGITILLVSHDIEFCARYSDRCGMFFDGEIIGIDNPRNFFSGNNFYTTNINKLLRDWNDCVLWEEASSWIKMQN